ncbi:MAG TPA: methyltransferase domain-containing protein [Methylotenera sp.]|nr:methyltransferase domain-containing protein [Methylotenera sp.]
MQNLAWISYNQNSRYYFDQYNSLKFSKVHRSFSKFLPVVGSNILDVGSGSGRDAFALAKKGYFVTAVEPSTGMLNLAKQYFHHEKITWMKDSLPSLASLKSSKQKYDFILLSAVWMHINPEKRKRSLRTLAELLSEKGVLAITLRIGPTIPERFIHDADVKSLVDLAKSIKLEIIYMSRFNKDSLSREDIRWQKIVLTKSKL